jgi:5'-nucleotidase/UDP-sugar diphosphatase
MNTKKFTILHSNDMHGDFLAQTDDQKKNVIGGLSLLSGYINTVREQEENVLYVISGDMVQGSLIDSEYKGISTIEIMNYLSPDVVALGNHEFDYGLPHLLFLEKMANFPVVNANLYIKHYHKRLMRPYHIIKKAGFEILFTGIITEKVMDSINMDALVGSFVTLEEASGEVGKICNAYKRSDIDLTIVLTHIGFESDKKLASLLKPEWGVDMIIGGHSHTFLSEPAKVNDILIAQAGTNTDQIGRFDITVDDDTNSIVEYSWSLVNLTSENTKPDKKLEAFIQGFQHKVDAKYNTVLSKFTCELTHPVREEETTLGNLIADAFAEICEASVQFVGSGSIRVKSLGPVVTLKDLKACFPYDDAISRFTVTGSVLKKIFSHIMRKENRNNEGECYQVNGSVRAIYDDKKSSLISLRVNEKDVEDITTYTIALQNYHVTNAEAYMGISQNDLLKNGVTVVTTSAATTLEEWFRNNQNTGRVIEGRLVYQ